MKTTFVCIALVGIVVLAGLTVYAKPDDFIKSFERSAQATVGNTNSTLNISAVTDFQWDKLFIFGPYTPLEKIYMQLGYKWTEAEKTHIDSSDTFYTIVFVKNGKVIRYYNLSRTIGDFQSIDVHNMFTPENAEFEVKSVDDGTIKRFSFFAKQQKQSNSK
jgi:hypothetical protein